MDNAKPGEMLESMIEAVRAKAELIIAKLSMKVTSPMSKLEGSL
ncbi:MULTISPECIES: hypothetical protein [Paenibacillus]|nr:MULTISPECIES: hypothetical protein [Paenibacillus]